MSILTRIPGILWKIGIAGVVLNLVFPHPMLNWIALLCFFTLLDITFWLSIWMILGNLYAKISYGSKLPSKDNYDCKVDYILPFTGKWTVFNGGADKALSHSWDIIPQRYAYDFIIMDDEGKSFRGDSKNLQSYYCYGEDVIAPADGIVVKVSNKHRDSRVTGTKVFCDTWDIRGNFIVIKHAEKEFSVVAHLIPGSIPQQVGDKVKQGEVIGKCGNSGNTSEPHIHFQLQSGKSFFASAGLPISFVNVRAQEKANYDLADPRDPQKELQEARGDGRVYIGRGLEVENK